jgi:hypothetical protein
MKNQLTIIQVYDIEVYINGLCVGNAESATMCVGERIIIEKVFVKHYKIYKENILMIGESCIITYKHKRKKYAVSGVLHESSTSLNKYNPYLWEASLSISL